MKNPIAYTPIQVAEMLQLNKNTVYELISRGELIAKKIGKVYRIPKQALSFIFSGLDYDLLQAQKEDKTNLKKINKVLKNARSQLK